MIHANWYKEERKRHKKNKKLQTNQYMEQINLMNMVYSEIRIWYMQISIRRDIKGIKKIKKINTNDARAYQASQRGSKRQLEKCQPKILKLP
jgi:hypothetical protein